MGEIGFLYSSCTRQSVGELLHTPTLTGQHTHTPVGQCEHWQANTHISRTVCEYWQANTHTSRTVCEHWQANNTFTHQ